MRPNRPDPDELLPPTRERLETIETWREVRAQCRDLGLGVYVHPGPQAIFGFTENVIGVGDARTADRTYCTVGGGPGTDPVTTIEAINFAVLHFIGRHPIPDADR